MDSKNKTLTIAILVGGIIDDFTKTVCDGACSEAAARGVNVVIFPGKYLKNLKKLLEVTWKMLLDN